MQAGFLQIQENGVDAVERSKAALRQAAGRMARFLLRVGIAQLELRLTALFKNAQSVSRLADGELRQRFDEWQDTVQASVVGRDRIGIQQGQRLAIRAVGLTVTIVFDCRGPVVVERRAPEQRPVIHHAVAHIAHCLLMAKAAGHGGNTQVAGIDELDKGRRFVVEQHVGIAGIGRAEPYSGWSGAT